MSTDDRTPRAEEPIDINDPNRARAPLSAFGIFVDRLIENRWLVLGGMLVMIWLGLRYSPFESDWGVERDPIAVDAIPDIGENQQIIQIMWMGRSPQDIDDQLTYPLASSLMGVPGVTTVRSTSMLGMALVYVIFDEDVEFYWSRSRIQEALASLPPGLVPEGATLTLGPDATALGQVYFYTLEGRTPEGAPAGGWDLNELRSIQDWQVRYALREVAGVSEVASVGGHVQSLVVEPDPLELRARGIDLHELWGAVRDASAEVGASTTELNGVEYILRGRGFARSAEDIEQAVVRVVEGVPVRVGDLARVSLQPTERIGALDKGGAEAVGGIVVARYGTNPMAALEGVHTAVEALNRSLPSKTLADGTISQVQVVPYLDRSELIRATIGTLESSLQESILITIVVVLVLMGHLRSSVLISGLLPLAVLWCFVVMKWMGVTANVVALSGIAIAIGTMADLGIVATENIVERVKQAAPDIPLQRVIAHAAGETAGPTLTALMTTVLSFLPVFFLEGAEGKLFSPLAFTKTWALLLSYFIAMTVIPVGAWFLLRRSMEAKRVVLGVNVVLLAVGVYIAIAVGPLIGALVVVVAALRLFTLRDLPPASPKARVQALIHQTISWLIAIVALIALAQAWMPLGVGAGNFPNALFTVGLLGGILLGLRVFEFYYRPLLRFVLSHRSIFAILPLSIMVLGLISWQGIPRLSASLPEPIRESGLVTGLGEVFPGLGREFMPTLDEGAFLYMPTAAPHASLGEIKRLTAMLDQRIEAIPEIQSAVSKIGRAETALDPAPLSMLETVITYHSEYIEDEQGRRMTFRSDGAGNFLRDEADALIPAPRGDVYRQWRPEITSTDDIWAQIVHAGEIPGLTGAPVLQPISARVVMLQSGIRAAMALRLRGHDLNDLFSAAQVFEGAIREHPMVARESVVADRTAGRPYLVIDADRARMAAEGVTMAQLQSTLEGAVGGMQAATLYQGRERYAVSVRLPRDARDDVESIGQIPVMTASGALQPLSWFADLNYELGPMMITAENGQMVTWVMFGGVPGSAEVDVVESVREYLDGALDEGAIAIPSGVRYDFVGSYESAERANARLAILIPIAVFIVFIVLQLQLRSPVVTAMVFSGVIVAAGGGMIGLWVYNWAEGKTLLFFGHDLLEVFQIVPTNLSVAVWVGFIALAGITTDDGVVMASWLQQRFQEVKPKTREDVRRLVLEVGERRIRPCLMTTATTILALLPVMTSKGTGADVMVPMAIPAFGGMLFEVISLFIVPALYSAWQEHNLPPSGPENEPTRDALDPLTSALPAE